ncbi:RimK family protein [Cerasicoccus arenae]|uniref:Ribosomal protein S6 modification protein n=1 Tax=Cerasicoccus arenae TaxID=424488 RepID=A0A8J3DCT3_9BACT|nr:RimK family protein [Cerasicoccus arenae]MBK1857626.1 RimK family protein [Cerasicoccus arenae]GHC05491.1 ribosomal protein S6 modification protein [Cerasicoccus arenae]
MIPYLFVTDRPEKWADLFPAESLVTARDYLTNAAYTSGRAARVINLCASYRYQSKGYYVSLVAEARKHRPLPAIDTVQDTKLPSIIRLLSSELDDAMKRALAAIDGTSFDLEVFFARTKEKVFERLGRQIFNLFPAPLVKAHFRKTSDGWGLVNIDLVALTSVGESSRQFLAQAVERFITRGHPAAPRKQPPRFYVGILYDPTENSQKASNPRAIEKFIDAGRKLGIECELLDKDDYGEIGEYDGLFIRETTAVNHYTYRFARKAEREGLVVIDDAQSILKCANKVFLAELLSRLKIPTPQTVLFDRDMRDATLAQIGLPVVIKKPDSSFSMGVKKAETKEEWLAETTSMFESSELLVAQQFTPSAFDWRITVLNGELLFACKYFMAHKHWQIYKQTSQRNTRAGRSEAILPGQVPAKVLRTALKAANAIGRGLYGVDLKEVNGEVVVIEVNDNPSIDAGVEDELLRDELYRRIMSDFLRRMEKRTALKS